jgi:serine/threonine protein kinase
MEYVEGQDLEGLLKWNGPLSVERALRLARDLGEALDCLHAAGVLQRDLKSSNLMVRQSDGSAALMDLGLAQVQDATALTGTGQIVGTPLYLPPEALKDQGWSAASDIYQMGALRYEVLVGKTLIEGVSIEDVLHALVSFLPGGVEKIRLEVADWVIRKFSILGERREIRYRRLSVRSDVKAHLAWKGGEGPQISLQADPQREGELFVSEGCSHPRQPERGLPGPGGASATLLGEA